MNDPHVEKLFYELRSGEDLSFDSPPSLENITTTFRSLLDNSLLTVEMKEHYATEVEARRCVEPWLLSWEIEANLRLGKGMIQFEFQSSKTIDRNPPPQGEANPFPSSFQGNGEAVVSFKSHVIHSQYPSPPAKFKATPDVETMWNRYVGYLEGREPLLSMAYACLTLLEASTNATKKVREAFCAMYKIDRAVRDKFGDIVSESGDAHEARKLGGKAQLTPLTAEEKHWVEEMVKALIRRKAEYDDDPKRTLDSYTKLPDI